MKERIVLDTNCLMASISKRRPEYIIWRKFLDEEFILCFSTEILYEYQEILERYLTKNIANNVINEILQKDNTLRIEVFYRFNLITVDKDDNKFVDCAISSNAKCIVSNDSHFNELSNIDFPKIKITKVNDFIEGLKTKLNNH